MRAPIPSDQSLRLAAIEHFDLGEQRFEDDFQGIVELAAQICECPIALVSIVREEEQSFEARCGLDASSTDLDSSVCSHAILQRDVFEIEDMRRDVRTADNPLVTDLDDPLLFYAGAPIVTPANIALGSLCVLDRVPRRLDAKQRRALQVLAEQVMQRLLLHEALRQQDMLRREVDHRVKNNLANVAVLTHMAARGAEHEETRDALEAVERRIQVMVELHSELYSRTDGVGEAAVDVPDYLGRVVQHLQAIAPEGVRLHAAFDPLVLESRRASALGVLVNELASNACKHGFPGDRAGEIRITGRREAGRGYAVRCADDGVGAAGGGTAGSGLGLRIARASAAQLGGALDIGPGETGWRGIVVFEAD
ncbi:histidine kinase dimerization/phosphoacceptor domain -containing protein [Jannaschia sp. W003]|uniref:histidine kinase dimerization/phosphoacceptor domain -containing protein n=1 Tax=Jannaschia sp. W003 TaxID=2867012 RepID=UPI0021A7CDAD|nr:histidine kinase dimerization/phosphoacceptor domain -containing protein [Jannaschia sp. W003]UWQ20939.1 hypothetical protein K3554_13325 [Jannaschia sp. W003]